MATIKQLEEFYNKNRSKYSKDKQNKIDYLFRILESSFGDTAHVHEIEQILQKKEINVFDILINFNEWKPSKNPYFASKL